MAVDGNSSGLDPDDKLLSDQVDFHENKGFTHAHAQSWAMMHYFFFHEPENFDKLGHYIVLLNNGMSYDEALMTACGLTLEELLQEVKRYMAQKRLHYSRMRINQVDLTPQVKLRSITPVEAREVLSDLLVLVTNFKRVLPERPHGC